jgi:hypothetical protein
MATKYCCKRCDFNTLYFNDLKRHLNKKRSCNKNNEIFLYSDDQILVLTLIPFYEGIHLATEDEIEHLKDSNLIHNNKDDLIKIVDEIEKNKLKCCKLCNKNFSKIHELKKHVVLNCFFNELKKEEKRINTTNAINIENNMSNTNNTTGNSYMLTNSNNNTFNTNNISINVEIKSPIPFDDDWNISNIDTSKKSELIISNMMYSKLLEEILKNEINLNVILDSKTESGMVYKNDIVKYINMKSKDIIEATMEKLNKYLIDFNKDMKNDVFKDVINFSRQMINHKYFEYMKKDSINTEMNELLSSAYNDKKDDAMNVAKKTVKRKSVKSITKDLNN